MLKKSAARYADKIFLNKFLSLPIFIFIMGFIFYATFHWTDVYLKENLASLIYNATKLLSDHMTAHHVNPLIHSLVIDGLCTGIGSVLAFIPTIGTLFFFLSTLEESGYIYRAAYIMNRPMRFLGLPGEAIIPMISGFGCSVPAIMAASRLSSDNDRKLTIAMIPFMSCSAKLPIYVIFAEVFFPRNETAAVACIYFSGIFISLLYALVLKRVFYGRKGIPSSYMVPLPASLPPYKIPSPRTVFRCVWVNIKNFIKKAFTVILIASIVVWVLQNFDSHMNKALSSGTSMLADMGKVLAPVFEPLGFGDWRAVSSVITGFSAKESIIGTLSILSETMAEDSLSDTLTQIFSPLSAFSFMIFSLLYVPCITSLIAVKNALGGWRYSVYMLVFQTLLAWIAAFLVFNIGRLMGF